MVGPGRVQTFKLTPSLRSTDDELSASQLNCEPHREFNYVFILNWHILSLVNPFQSQFHKLFRFDESNSTLLPQPRSRKSAMNSRDQVLAGQWFTRRLVRGWENTYYENGRMLRQLTILLKCQKVTKIDHWSTLQYFRRTEYHMFKETDLKLLVWWQIWQNKLFLSYLEVGQNTGLHNTKDKNPRKYDFFLRLVARARAHRAHHFPAKF